MTNELFIPFLLTLLAGLSTLIGSLIVLAVRRTNDRFFAFMMGLSAGAMLYLSFMEIMPEAAESLTGFDGDPDNLTVLFFFAGIALMALLEKIAHASHLDMHGTPHTDNCACGCHTPSGMLKTGRVLAIAIALHNLPEGLATFTTALHDTDLGILIAFAVAIHNIPIGIAIASPVYQATGSRGKAFRWTLLVGLTEPLGALIGLLFLVPFMSPTLQSALFAVVAGILVYIATIELIPSSRREGHVRQAGTGLVTGMAVMAVSMLLLHH